MVPIVYHKKLQLDFWGGLNLAPILCRVAYATRTAAAGRRKMFQSGCGYHCLRVYLLPYFFFVLEIFSQFQKSFSESFVNTKPNLDCNYTPPMDLAQQ